MRPLLLIIIAILTISPIALTQSLDDVHHQRPLTRREVRRWLTLTQDNAELSAEANRQLIAEIERRGVDFALSKEEEWAFTLLEASVELLEAIRDALPEAQRTAILEVREKRDLYTTFISNFSRTDLQSRRTAFEAGQEFVKRFASDPTVRDQRNFINRMLPQLDRSIKMLERGGRVRTN